MAHLVDSNPFKPLRDQPWFERLIDKNIRHVEQLAGLFYDSSGKLALELLGADLRGLENAIDSSLRGRGTSLEKLLGATPGSEHPSVPFRTSPSGHAYGLNDIPLSISSSFDSEVPESEKRGPTDAGQSGVGGGAKNGNRISGPGARKGGGNGGGSNNPPVKLLLPKPELPFPQNQHFRGTCVAFTGVSMIDLILRMKAKASGSHRSIPLFSAQWLYYKARDAHGAEDRRTDGTIFQYALDALIDVGVCRDEAWPYHSTPDFTYSSAFGERKEIDHLEQQAGECKVTSGELRYNRDVTVDWVKSQLSENRPVGIGVHIFKLAWENPYTLATGEIGLPITRVVDGSERYLDSRLGCHAVTIVGYADTDEGRSHRPGGGYFVFKNSWGGDWAPVSQETPSGYGMLPYEYVDRYSTSAVVFNDVEWITGQ